MKLGHTAPPVAAHRLSLLDWLHNARSASSPSILLLDGGVSTYLEQVLAQRGGEEGQQQFQHRELWSSSLLLTKQGCNDIADCHEAFCAAGADIISSVTYQCHYGAAAAGTTTTNIVDDDTMSDMIQKGLALSKQNTKVYVAASLGCYGAALADGSEYHGDYSGTLVTRQQLYDFHDRKLQAVLGAPPTIIRQCHQQPPSSASSLVSRLPVDAVALETVPNLEEMIVLVELLEKASLSERGVAVWISLACRNGHQLNDGTEVERVLDELCRLDPDGTIVPAVGFNCCHGKHISSLLRILTLHMATKKGPKRGIVVYPNSGEDWDATTASWKQGTGCTVPQEFAQEMKAGLQVVGQIWREHCGTVTGESLPKLIVGGCCRTSPATIASLRAMIDEHDVIVRANNN